MTAGHDGTPENDDPFGYLYRSEGMEQPEPEAPQPRTTPRTSYNSVQRVGERRPAPPQQPQQGGYGYPQQGQKNHGQGQGQPPYGGPQQQGYDTPPPGGRRGRQSGQDTPSRKGLLIGAVAVVAAVAIGIAFAMTNGSGDDGKKQADGKATSAPVTSTAPTTEPTPSATPTEFASPKVDAATLALAGGAQQSNQWPGADAANGTYVDHMGQPGASATWTVTVPRDDSYTLFISYGNAGKDANLTLAVNGTPRSNAVNLNNFGHYTEWDKAWSNHTYQWVDLKKGANTLSLTCVPNTNCGVNLDQVWLKQGQVTK
ncbi:carbohydrate-binding protein [Actinacidiphila sp. ITFR-21]|uniref:carbohydrate-binding protein n=1 Tax=Actinacidiphila sp. ITFR-21 TaxID=3075199 RepID=UPI00288AC967|nr:carbohydrate-binding protein [Streptomyces sp. ITFR-21]WNI16049.1 carbohydrate-binding protein [Streptomyces sp. ITFR-21]